MFIRKFVRPFIYFLVAVSVSSAVLARDISAEQRSSSQARDAYNAAASDYDAISQRRAAQEKHVADEQARLKELQDSQAAAEAKVAKTKAELDIREQALEKAWNERSQ
jgi:septal ring factor EnvC (AmiA/AmiB activator)